MLCFIANRRKEAYAQHLYLTLGSSINELLPVPDR